MHDDAAARDSAPLFTYATDRYNRSTLFCIRQFSFIKNGKPLGENANLCEIAFRETIQLFELRFQLQNYELEIVVQETIFLSLRG